MADVVNKQKKSQSQRRKAYYTAQFAKTERNKKLRKARHERRMAAKAAKRRRWERRNRVMNCLP